MASVVEDMESLVSGKLQVPVQSLEKELKRIWRESASVDQKEEASKKGIAASRVRAILANLVIVTCGGEGVYSRRVIDSLLTELCISQPSRYFVLSFESGLEKLQTAVSSRCVRTLSGAHVCSEEIYLAFGPNQSAVVPQLLLSLLVPDVNTELIVLCDPAGSPNQANGQGDQVKWQSFLQVLTGLEKISDRILVDSAIFSNYAFSVNLLQKLTTDRYLGWNEGSVGSSGFAVGGEGKLNDLSWLRGVDWRGAIAEHLSLPHLVSSLDQVQRLTFTALLGGEGEFLSRFPREMFLLAAWLTDRLGWTCQGRKGKEDALLFQTSSGKTKTVEWKGEAGSGAGPSVLRRLELEFSGGKKEFQLQFAVSPEGKSLLMTEVYDGKAQEVLGRVSQMRNLSIEELYKSYFHSQYAMKEYQGALQVSLQMVRAFQDLSEKS